MQWTRNYYARTAGLMLGDARVALPIGASGIPPKHSHGTNWLRLLDPLADYKTHEPVETAGSLRSFTFASTSVVSSARLACRALADLLACSCS